MVHQAGGQAGTAAFVWAQGKWTGAGNIPPAHGTSLIPHRSSGACLAHHAAPSPHLAMAQDL